MSEEQLKIFLEAIKEYAELQKKLNTVKNPDDVVAITKEAGFVISAEELQPVQAEVSEDDELGGVTGGVGIEVEVYRGPKWERARR